MKNKTITTLSWILVITALLLCALSASARPVRERGPLRLDVADPAAQRSLIMHDIGNVRTTLSNWGELGNPDGVPGFKGFEFPINSGNDFLFSAGLWVGAIADGRRLVTTSTDGDNGTNEFWPVHITTVPSTNLTWPDWFVTSKSFQRFGDRDYVFGTKEIDDDNDFSAARDLRENTNYADTRPLERRMINYDGGVGLIGVDDDNDGQIDEEIANGIDDDGDGLIDEDTDATGDANHDGNCNYDPMGHIDEDPAGDISHDYIDNDFDGLVDLADPDLDGDLNPGFLDDDNDGLSDEDGVARGAQEYYCVYQDDIQSQFVGSPDSDGHTPLKIQVLQRSYAFPEAYAGGFILIDYRIRNVGPLPLKNVYIAMFSDPDIGAAGEGGDAASLDDGNYYDSTRTMMIQYDDSTDSDGRGPGIFAIRVVKTPAPLDQLKVSFRNFDRVSGGDPATNIDKYNMISSGQQAPPTATLGDWRMLMGFGDRANDGFEIPSGGELPITVALIAGRDIAEGNKNAEWALKMFLNDFKGPAAPDVPQTVGAVLGEAPSNAQGKLDVYPDKVRVRWSPNAEKSVDPITGFQDFEGYIIERSTDQVNWQTLVEYDKIDRLDTLWQFPYPAFPDSHIVITDPERLPFETQNFNLGMPRDTLWFFDSTYTDTTGWVKDSAFQYYYMDESLIPGHTYYYCVRAFDKGVPGAGILYSGRTGNVMTAIIALGANAVGNSTDLDKVYVFPNPYKGSHAGEQGGQVNATKGLIEYPRKLVFMGLPASTHPGDCLIRIFSLGGDHLMTIDHYNGLEYDQWDLVTKNKQDIVSGIYFFTIEWKKPSGGTAYHIDKFVVIK